MLENTQKQRSVLKLFTVVAETFDNLDNNYTVTHISAGIIQCLVNQQQRKILDDHPCFC